MVELHILYNEQHIQYSELHIQYSETVMYSETVIIV